MSYSTIHTCANDPAFCNRVTSAVAQEQLARDEPVNPGLHAGNMFWSVASAADVEAAYASALAAENPNPGGDEAVITDGMILAHVQAGWPDPAP
jgi:hypothetical protein